MGQKANDISSVNIKPENKIGTYLMGYE